MKRGKGQHYTPEIVQLTRGMTMGRYAVPNYAIALLADVLYQAEWAFWNQHQLEWDKCVDFHFPPLRYRPYWWGDESDPRAGLPNCEGYGIRIWWYKHPRRGVSADRAWSEVEWVRWFTRCRGAIRRSDPAVELRRSMAGCLRCGRTFFCRVCLARGHHICEEMRIEGEA